MRKLVKNRVKLKLQPNRGFTLIELMFVVLIIGILYTVGAVVVGGRITYAKEAALKHDLAILRKNVDDYYADKGKYPATLQDLVDNKYMRLIPDDPMTKAPDWTTIPSSKGNDVYDVKSSCTKIASDGKAYSDW